MTINVVSGPRCRFTLGGIPVALGRSVTVSEETRYEPIEVLDNLEVLEHEPVGYSCSMNVAEVMIIGKTLESKGWAALKGQTPQEHLRNLLSLEDIVAQIEDSTGDTVIARVYGCKVAGKSFGVDARGTTARDVSFVARRMVEADEAI